MNAPHPPYLSINRFTLRAPNRRLLLQLGRPDGGEWKPMSSFLGCHVGFWWEIHRLNPHLNKEGENLPSSDPSGDEVIPVHRCLFQNLLAET